MTQYLLRRMAGMVVVMFLVATIVFVIAHVIPGDPGGSDVGTGGYRGRYRSAAQPARPRCVAAGAIYRIPALGDPAATGRVDLPQSQRDAGAGGTSATDLAAHGAGRRARDADRRTDRRAVGGEARQPGGSGADRGLHGRRQPTELLDRTDPDRIPGGAAARAAGRRLRATGCRSPGTTHLPDHAGDRTWHPQFGTHHPLHAHQHVGRAAGGLRAHRASQRAGADDGDLQACVPQRAHVRC